MKVPQRVKRRKRNVHEVADPAHVHKHLVRPFVAERPAKLSNHLVSTRWRLWRRVAGVSTRREGMSMHNVATKFNLGFDLTLSVSICVPATAGGFIPGNHLSCRSTESITPMTAESMG